MDCLNLAPLTRSTRSPRILLALAASSAMLIAGCSNMVATNTTGASLANAASISGKVHGGNQPVSGATVHVRFAGQVGLGKPNPSPYDVVAATTSANDGSGSFSFILNPVRGASDGLSGNTFACPTSSDPLVYIEATGGNTLNNGTAGTPNSAAVFLAPLGLCTTISGSTFVDMSELTTTATMAALAQYFDPTINAIGSDGINAATGAMANSFALVGEMIDLGKGVANPSFTLPGSTSSGNNGVASVSTVGTPEVAKLNEIANIVSACVNTTGPSSTACATLFAHAMPTQQGVTSRPYGTTFPAATDVRQALYYIFTNPTNGSTANLQSLFNLAPAAGAPYQPALTAAPTDWTIAINYASNNICGSSGTGFINSPSDVNVDVYGNIWFANANTSNLSAISNTGTPIVCVSGTGTAKAGGVVDNKGNIWTAGSPSGILRYAALSSPPQALTPFTTPGLVLAIAADGAGNVYFSTAGSLYMIPGASTSSAAVAPVQISSVVGSPARIVVDNSNPSAIWSASGSNFISRTVSAASGSTNYLNGYSTTTLTVASPAYGIAVSPMFGSPATNTVYVTSGSPTNTVTQFNGSATTPYAPVSGWPTAAGFAGLNNPTSVVLDGAQNAWIPNLAANSTSALSSISEISSGEAALSPVGFQKSASYLGTGRAAMVDQSGNVWVVGDGASFITEIVGAGVPVYQPASYGLAASGRFQSIP